MKQLNLQKQKLLEEESGNIILSPLLFFDYTNKIQEGREYLPFSVGIEIECDFKPSFDYNIFKEIPYLMASSKSINEIRFRIHSGAKGLISLYLVCEYLKYHALLNPLSGIHLHIDFTDYVDIYISEGKNRIIEQADFILSELDRWETTSIQTRAVTTNKYNWVNVGTRFGTIEIRVCNMTFDYLELLAKINSACYISLEVKRNLIEGYSIPNFNESISKVNLYNYYNIYKKENKNNELAKWYNKKLQLKKQVEEVLGITEEEIFNIIKNRVIYV